MTDKRKKTEDVLPEQGAVGLEGSAGHMDTLRQWAHSPAGEEWAKGEKDRQEAEKAAAEAQQPSEPNPTPEDTDYTEVAHATGSTDNRDDAGNRPGVPEVK